MAQVGISELLWMATRGFRDIGTVLRPIMGDSGKTNGSDGVDFMSRFARINEGEKIFNLCGLSQSTPGCVTCHTRHASVTHFRPISGNIVEVTLMTSPKHVYNSHAKETYFP